MDQVEYSLTDVIELLEDITNRKTVYESDMAAKRYLTGLKELRRRTKNGTVSLMMVEP